MWKTFGFGGLERGFGGSSVCHGVSRLQQNYTARKIPSPALNA
jgi:hypothetical protein